VNRLLSAAMASLTHEAERDRGARPRLALWSNHLRVIPDDGITANDYVVAARISKRQVPPTLNVLRKSGLAEPGDAKRIELTATGRAARDAWASRVHAVDNTSLRVAIEPVVAALPLELPHHPIGYGIADERVTGGKDWRPVPRGEGDTVSGLPLVALVSQALLAFAIDFESLVPVSLTLVANVLRLVPDDGIAASALPALACLTPRAINLHSLERHGWVTMQDKAVRLTAHGHRVRDAYPSLIARIDATWRERHGDAAIDTLRAALARYERGDVPEHPDVNEHMRLRDAAR
jgi:hypothetical protein